MILTKILFWRLSLNSTIFILHTYLYKTQKEKPENRTADDILSKLTLLILLKWLKVKVYLLNIVATQNRSWAVLTENFFFFGLLPAWPIFIHYITSVNEWMSRLIWMDSAKGAVHKWRHPFFWDFWPLSPLLSPVTHFMK